MRFDNLLKKSIKELLNQHFNKEESEALIMSNRTFLIAAASSDGKAIDRHFGHSDCFSILAVAADGSYVLKERRSLAVPCQHGSHEEKAMVAAVEALSDCRYVLAEAVGRGAEAQLTIHGITPLEINALVTEAVEQVIIYDRRTHRGETSNRG